jgi:hypothetical protein
MTYKKMLELTRQNLSANFDGTSEKTTKMAINLKYENRRFDFKIINGTTFTDAKLALFIGSYPDIDQLKAVYPEVSAMIVDGTIMTVNEGTSETPVNKTITASSNSKKTIAHLQNFANSHIMQLSDLEFISNDNSNFQEDIQYIEGSPFNDTRDFVKIPIRNFVSTGQFDTNRAICKGVNIPIYAGIILVFTVRAASHINVSATFSLIAG